jgi:molybdenum cofactor cytidylyltransferase
MITGIILAAGLSRRMGSDKLLLPVDGIALVERVMQAADASLLDDIVVVYQNPMVRKLAERYRIRQIYNPDAEQGQSASVKIGVLAALPQTQAYMFLTGDQPFIAAGTINLLISAWRAGTGHIIVPVFEGKRGSPAIFPAACRPELLALAGDIGGRAVISAHSDSVQQIDIPDSREGIDVDTPQLYEEIIDERKQ